MRGSFLLFTLAFFAVTSTVAISTSAAQFAAQPAKPKGLAIINGPVVESAKESSAVIAWATNTGGSTVVRRQ